MDRQSAIQDIIDCNASQFLRQVIASPVSPVFKMRAVKLLLDPLNINGVHLNILPMIEQILRDDPREINILHHFFRSHDLRVFASVEIQFFAQQFANRSSIC